MVVGGICSTKVWNPWRWKIDKIWSGSCRLPCIRKHQSPQINPMERKGHHIIEWKRHCGIDKPALDWSSLHRREEGPLWCGGWRDWWGWWRKANGQQRWVNFVFFFGINQVRRRLGKEGTMCFGLAIRTPGWIGGGVQWELYLPYQRSFQQIKSFKWRCPFYIQLRRHRWGLPHSWDPMGSVQRPTIHPNHHLHRFRLELRMTHGDT